MRRLFVYRSSLLASSETFIKSQVLGLQRWKAILLGVEHVEGLSLDELDLLFLWGTPANLGERLERRLYWRTGYVRARLLNRLSLEKPQLIHAHFGPDALEIWPIARRLGIPLLVTLHGYDIHIRADWWRAGFGGAHRRNYPERLVALGQSRGVRFVAVSESIRDQAIASGIPPGKIAVRYVGIDTALFAPGTVPITSRPRRIVFIGRLVEKKGCRFLLDAFAALRGSVSAAELVIIGDGPERRALQEQALPMGQAVRFLGSVSPDIVRQNLNEARIVCMPSIVAGNGDAEGFGLVLLEAQACGIPVVSSALGGKSEGLLHDRTGFAFAEKDVTALSEYLLRLLLDDDLCARFSAAAREFVRERFELRDCCAGLENEYDRIAGHSRRT